MTSTSLLVAALATLLQGQGVSDARAYAAYQARLAEIIAPAPATSSAIPPAVKAAATTTPTCLLAPGSGNGATTADCTACHSTYASSSHTHPVDVYQDGGRSRSLRSSAEVVRRGVFLADGRVSCLSCHDGNSGWKYKLALPPGSGAVARVTPGTSSTYTMRAPVRLASASSTATMPTGSDVSPTPLCLACHALD